MMYLFGSVYERLCSKCVGIHGLHTFAAGYGFVGCIQCLVEAVLKQRGILRSYGVA